MKENNNEIDTGIWVNAASAGLILGTVLLVYTVLDYVLGYNGKHFGLSVLHNLSMVAGITFFTLRYRDRVCKGVLPYERSLAFGILLSAFSFVLTGAFLFVLMNFIDPSYLDLQIEQTMDLMIKQNNIPDRQMEVMEKAFQYTRNPIVILVSSVLVGAFMGLLISLFTSIFTQRKQSAV